MSETQYSRSVSQINLETKWMFLMFEVRRYTTSQNNG